MKEEEIEKGDWGPPTRKVYRAKANAFDSRLRYGLVQIRPLNLKKKVYRLLASVLSVETSPWQWLRVTSRQQLQVGFNSP